jgi:ABC-2 type transport system ATP-binding protein
MAPVIEVSNVSKRFRLSRDRANSFKDRFVRIGRHDYDEFWALREVDFVVEEGQTLGVLGHNGSGKSTLLKCIGGILQPTTGEIRSRGLIAALLELGAGFHPDLTGRENVYLNAALLGLSKKDTERRFDQIVAFAELEDFIDQQVKHYSSGMYVRLGFAVAINVEPEILLIDEVLAVGDEAFARKCMAKVKQFQKEGRTIILVTHAADLAREVCDRVLVLDHGHMVAEGEPGLAIRAYRDHLFATGRGHEVAAPGAAESTSAEVARAAVPIRIADVRISNPDGGDRDYLLAFERLLVEVDYEASEPCEAVVGIGVYNEKGERVWGSNNRAAGVELGKLTGSGTVRFVFGSVPLLDGNYTLQVGLTDADGQVFDWIDSMPGFRVAQLDNTVGVVAMPFAIEHAVSNGAGPSVPREQAVPRP